MTAEWVAVVVAILAAAITGTVAVTSGFRRLADAIAGVDQRVAALAERVARLEGALDTVQSVLLADRRQQQPRTGTDEGAAA